MIVIQVGRALSSTVVCDRSHEQEEVGKRCHSRRRCVSGRLCFVRKIMFPWLPLYFTDRITSARDNALPGSRWWKQINRRTQTPVNAVWFVIMGSVICGVLVFSATALSSLAGYAVLIILNVDQILIMLF